MKNRIKKLKNAKNAIILAHYYTPNEIQEVADYVGDSYYLAKIAKENPANIIVFCGVSFMGESAKILNPDTKVLMPNLNADCPMAHMVPDGFIDSMRAVYDNLAVVCYINSSVELKCQSDVCVTSSNAIQIVKALPNKNIFFIPDRNLGRFVAKQVPEKNIIINDGYCPIHAQITIDNVASEIKKHPHAKVLSHPECNPDILEISDYVGSTSDIIGFTKHDEGSEYIICTEAGINHTLVAENPHKMFYFPTPYPCCEDMKMNTIENLLDVLENETNMIEIDETIRQKALVPLNRMLELGK